MRGIRCRRYSPLKSTSPAGGFVCLSGCHSAAVGPAPLDTTRLIAVCRHTSVPSIGLCKITMPAVAWVENCRSTWPRVSFEIFIRSTAVSSGSPASWGILWGRRGRNTPILISARNSTIDADASRRCTESQCLILSFTKKANGEAAIALATRLQCERNCLAIGSAEVSTGPGMRGKGGDIVKSCGTSLIKRRPSGPSCDPRC